MGMSFLGLLVVLAVIGLLAWAFTTFIPMPGNIKTLIVVVAGVVALMYVLSAFGVLHNAGSIQVPKIG